MATNAIGLRIAYDTIQTLQSGDEGSVEFPQRQRDPGKDISTG